MTNVNDKWYSGTSVVLPCARHALWRALCIKGFLVRQTICIRTDRSWWDSFCHRHTFHSHSHNRKHSYTNSMFLISCHIRIMHKWNLSLTPHKWHTSPRCGWQGCHHWKKKNWKVLRYVILVWLGVIPIIFFTLSFNVLNAPWCILDRYGIYFYILFYKCPKLEKEKAEQYFSYIMAVMWYMRW